jgi:hypothetical protein
MKSTIASNLNEVYHGIGRKLIYLVSVFTIWQCAGVYDIEPHVATHSITSITPECGKVGDTIVIRGDKFSEIAEENIVTINGSRAFVIQASSTFLTAIVPARSGSGNVRVTLRDSYVEGPSFTYFPRGVVTIFNSDISNTGGMDADASNNIYIAHPRTNRVDVQIPNVGLNYFVGGGRTTVQSGYHNDVGRLALFNDPADVAVDSKGNIYISDTGNHCIRRVTPDGVVTLYAGVYNPAFPSPQRGFKDGLRTEAFFDQPSGIAIDTDDNLYVCDKGNSRIRKITPDNGNAIGVVTTIAGNGDYGSNDGPAAQATFGDLYDLVVDDDQNIFVTEEQEDPKIRTISKDGIVRTIITGYTQLYTGCKGERYILSGAFGICLGPEGNLYCGIYSGTNVNDEFSYSYKIITVAPDGKVNTLAGGGGTPNGPFEGIGENVYIPYVSSIVQIGDALYVGADYQLLKIDLN